MYPWTTLFFRFTTTQLARQVQQERTQVVCSNKVARKRLARRHPRNGPSIWTHECCFEVDVFVCLEWIEELEWELLLRMCLFFFLGFRRPNLITRLSNDVSCMFCLIGCVCVS